MSVGLWLGDVVTSAEFWLVRAAQFSLGMLRVVRAHPVLAAITMVTCAGGSFAFAEARENAFYEGKRAAMVQMKAIAQGIDGYAAEHHRLPSRLEDLVPAHAREVPSDPWGHPFALYRGDGGYALVSAGPDGALGTGDDLLLNGPSK